jgi:hypothetical protein
MSYPVRFLSLLSAQGTAPPACLRASYGTVNPRSYTKNCTVRPGQLIASCTAQSASKNTTYGLSTKAIIP